jgi:hypothetical protein
MLSGSWRPASRRGAALRPEGITIPARAKALVCPEPLPEESGLADTANGFEDKVTAGLSNMKMVPAASVDYKSSAVETQ